jgi:hypothetical protein
MGAAGKLPNSIIQVSSGMTPHCSSNPAAKSVNRNMAMSTSTAVAMNHPLSELKWWRRADAFVGVSFIVQTQIS